MTEAPSYEHAPENELPLPVWQRPRLEEEMGELKRHSEESGIDINTLVQAFVRAELEELPEEDWLEMENCDSNDPTWTIERVREHLSGQRDFDRIETGLRAGDAIPAPAVLYRKGHRPNLLAGNSRLLGCRALGIRPKVLTIRLDE